MDAGIACCEALWERLAWCVGLEGAGGGREGHRGGDVLLIVLLLLLLLLLMMMMMLVLLVLGVVVRNLGVLLV